MMQPQALPLDSMRLRRNSASSAYPVYQPHSLLPVPERQTVVGSPAGAQMEPLPVRLPAPQPLPLDSMKFYGQQVSGSPVSMAYHSVSASPHALKPVFESQPFVMSPVGYHQTMHHQANVQLPSSARLPLDSMKLINLQRTGQQGYTMQQQPLPVESMSFGRRHSAPSSPIAAIPENQPSSFSPTTLSGGGLLGQQPQQLPFDSMKLMRK
eukprot:TRINITY_DN10580_c0_g1_i3.p2 TRINITY_DN10580_c0_g1~~TRINITY_DN10580_c0_g1_i3.p2  ORF type:complete len:210 (-),score=32.20 TRINITY_DN10580_c0_g1_i3:99-728(-)